MPRIPNNLRERAIGMLDAGLSIEHVARHVGRSRRAIRNLRIDFERQEAPTWSRSLYHEHVIDSKLPLLLLLTHLGFIITESVRKLIVTVCGRTVYMHDVLKSDAS